MPYRVGQIQGQGFANLLGAQTFGTHTCTWRYSNGQTTLNEVSNFTVDAQNVVQTVGTLPVAQVRALCAAGAYGGDCAVANKYSSGGGCPASLSQFGLVYKFVGEVKNDIQTGIFEYQPLVYGIGAMSVLIVIIIAGVVIARRTVKATVEETSEEDNLEYYEGADGKEYWRIKRRGFN